MTSPLESVVARILKERLGFAPTNLLLTKLHGDASYRTYYRLSLEGTVKPSYILMKLPEGPASASEEITNLKEKPPEPTFLSIGRYLKAKGLPVPEIIHYDQNTGLLLLEDFGDETLEKRLPRCSPKEKEAWYRKAIDLLVLLQKRGMEEKGRCLAHQRSFDATLLNWEFDHFIEYGIEARQGITVAPEDLKAIRQGTNFITFALTRLPLTFTHRDFQSRNLMIQEESLKLLDFQDALLGPLPYDLVALLRDSYVTLPWEMVLRLIDHYLKNRTETSEDKTDADFFCKVFDWMTVQRKLKDAGRFVYIDRVKGNPSFLKYIPASLAYVREALARHEELKDLLQVLRKYVPEFR